MPDSTTVVARADVAWSPAGTEVVVRVPATDAMHVLDPTAALLWQCLDGESPLQLVFSDLADAFGVSPDVIAADSLPAVISWVHAGIAVVPATTATATATAAPSPSAAPAARQEPSPRTWRRLVDPPNT
jgi:hypothetical protein